MDSLHSYSLGDLLREHRRSNPQQIALVCGDARFSYPEMDARVNRLASGLRARGFQTGDRILWLGQNSHRILEGLLAAAKLGGVFCPANWRQTPDELGFVIADSDPKLILWQAQEIGEAARQARKQTQTGALWLQHDGGGPDSYESFLAAAPENDRNEPIDPSLPVLQMYTAAFSGKPGGALLSHTACMLQSLVMAKLQEIDRDYVYLNCGPLFHIATFMTTLAVFQWAGTNVFTPRVEAEELCRLIEAEKCTGAFVMGPTLGKIVELNQDGRFNLKSLRAFRGTPAWNEMTSPDTSAWGRRPAGYGQTECMGMLTLNALGAGSKGTSGRPTPLVQVRIVDPDGVEVPAGETGEIVARGPTIMNGYLNRAEINAARQRGGWHHTNDLGRRELDGSLSFIGPKGRIVKSAAENIYPAEVESCLKQHPAVADCAIIGVPDPKWTQNVKAVVVLKAGQTASAEELSEHCRARIASYKKPKSVEFVAALPRKGWDVDYEALDAQFGGGGYPGAGSS